MNRQTPAPPRSLTSACRPATGRSASWPTASARRSGSISSPRDRATTEWQEASRYDPAGRGEPIDACIDGQQRISGAIDWFEDQVAVPASWFNADDVTATEDTVDGPCVRWSGLTLPWQRHFADRALLTVALSGQTPWP
ncbi:hypothetical protein ACIBQ3_33060 [Streptomyces rubiginosohelvolus]|uniref:hypothetical protein n=1 Tax=Streptomyces rubiginosohelvolus TaxID=67362 RepID=UPI00379DA7D5